MTKPLLCLFSIALLTAACGARERQEPAAEAAPASPAEGAAPAAAAGDSPVGMVSSRGEVVAGGTAAADAGGGNLDYKLPADWTSQAPSSSMRMAQAAIPGRAGAGELAVFHFGPGEGGGVEANIERWLGQMEIPAGVSPKRESFSANGLAVTLIDVSGTLLPSTMGMGPTEAQPNSRLLGAVVEGPGGPWFFKATGPEETLAGARGAFVEMIKGARVK
jgi:hypothetical protein